MFSGIVEATGQILEAQKRPGVIQIKIKKPNDFNDIKEGDSIAVNGICLTVEAYDDNSVQFALAAETLQVTGWKAENLKGQEVNLERSLRFGDRLHGSIMTGHVDTVGHIADIIEEGESWFIWVEIPEDYMKFMWKKSSVILNGVSLTINEVEANKLQVCLIPETLQRTNLKQLKKADPINVEVDFLNRSVAHLIKDKI
ncbi:MAG: riboflavin synthase [Bdellovibrionales bacterium]|nr:riboflavin synthase [Bdellovibrionales bacterium]